jgi:DNA-binding GntR family transcriptional regulator
MQPARLVVQNVTIADHVYDTIRKAIIEHRLAPGQRLVTDPLSERLRVSRTPVIVCLTRLRQEGLATYTVRHGYQVAQTPIEALPDLFDARTMCEIYGVSKRFLELEEGALSALGDAICELEALAKSPGTNQQWYRIESAIHGSLVALARNSMVSNIHERGMALINTIWPPVPTAETPYENAPSLLEHRKILDGLEKRDISATEEAIRQHGNSEMKRLVSFMYTIDYSA